MVNNKAAAFVDQIGISKAEIKDACWRELRNISMNVFEWLVKQSKGCYTVPEVSMGNVHTHKFTNLNLRCYVKKK